MVGGILNRTVSSVTPSYPTTLLLMSAWLLDFDVFVRQCSVPEGEASGGAGWLLWWQGEAGGVVPPGGGSPWLRGPRVCAAAKDGPKETVRGIT